MNKDVQKYHAKLDYEDKLICEELYRLISLNLPNAENKVWHAHPVWFLDGNPIVGYHKLKDNVRMLFWSGQSFDEPGLAPEGTFKAAELRFTNMNQINQNDIERYLKKAIDIQWDYKNLMKRRELIRLK